MVEINKKDWLYCGTIKKKPVGLAKVIYKAFFFGLTNSHLYVFPSKYKKKKTVQTEEAVISMRSQFEYEIFGDLKKKKFFLKIVKMEEEKNKPFVLSFNSLKDLEQWKEKIDEAGGKIVPLITYKKYTQWTSFEVYRWLKYSFSAKDKIKFSNFSKIDGSKLGGLRNKELMDLGIKTLFERKEFLEKINELKITKTFNFSYHSVRTKILRILDEFNLESPEFDNFKLNKLSLLLSNEKLMKQSYFNPFIEKRKQYINETPRPEKFDHYKYKESKDPKYFVRFIVTEFDACNSRTIGVDGRKENRKIKDIFSPFIKDFHMNSFGDFVYGVIVGHWFLQFSSSGLIIPRKVDSIKSFVFNDVGKCFMITNHTLDSLANLLAKIVVQYNSKPFIKPSKVFNIDRYRSFFGSLFSAIGIEENRGFEIVLSSVLGSTRYHEENKSYVFSPSHKFTDEFGLEGNTFYFSSHLELDEFANLCIKKNAISFQMDHKQDTQLLKSYDRLFWMRKFHGKDENNFHRCEPTTPECPFSNPKTMNYKQWR